jgi:hypothetical protein
MHPEAYNGFIRMLHRSEIDPESAWRILDIGGRDINGSVRSLLPNAQWTGLDITAGPGVDIVADAREWKGEDLFDVVVCTEVFEHVQDWARIVSTAARHLDIGGPQALIVTCASTGRQAHGAWGDPLPGTGEWYANVSPEALRTALVDDFQHVHVEYQPVPGDAYALAERVRPFSLRTRN